MKTLQLDDKTARNIYPTAAAELKTILEQNWGKNFFSVALTERIKTWEDVAAEYSIHPVQSLPYPSPKNPFEISVNGYFKLAKITELFNEGTFLDYSDSNQGKYYPYFHKTSSGFAFSHASTYFGATDASVGPRLSLKSRALAEFVGKTFVAVYNEFYTQ